MTRVEPFRGQRYAESVRAADVVCEPYDVISSVSQRAYHDRSEYNAVHFELGYGADGDDEISNRYTRASASLADWLASGVLAEDPRPAFYVLRETWGPNSGQSRIGVFGALRLAEWAEGSVLPHERTMPKPKADRLRLLQATSVNTSPLFLMYDDSSGTIAGLLVRATARAPLVEVALNGGTPPSAAPNSALWRIDDPEETAAIATAFEQAQLYIADGHHRYETALEYWRGRRAAGAPADDPASMAMVLLVACQDPGMRIHPTHRIVRFRDGIPIDTVDRLGHWFDIQDSRLAIESGVVRRLSDRLAKSDGGPAFAAIGLRPGKAHLLTARDPAALRNLLPQEQPASWRNLDVVTLHEIVLARALGLNGDDSAKVEYTREAARAEEAMSEPDTLVFLLNAPSVAQVQKVADERGRMPEKSTYFWPKPLTGLVMRRIYR